MPDYIRRFRKALRDKVKGPEIQPWPASPYPGLDLVYWHPRDGVNFGDELSRIVVMLMLAEHGYTAFDELSETRHLLTIGSNMHFAREGSTVWGSGVHGGPGKRAYNFRQLDVRAVRGHLTQEFLRKRGIPVPDVFGDPALLLPRLTRDRFKTTRDLPVAFVPNINDDLSQLKLPAGVPLISPLQSWNRCVAEILRCEFIVASSLHGLIVAEAWGIPARYVRLFDYEGMFKYRDYYSGTGRSTFEFASSIEEAIQMGGEAPAVIDVDGMYRSFPLDLWSATLRASNRRSF